MNFETIFKDKGLLRKAVVNSCTIKNLSDCNGVAGGQFEIEIMKEFNRNNKDFKILNVKALEKVISFKGEGFFDYFKHKLTYIS